MKSQIVLNGWAVLVGDVKKKNCTKAIVFTLSILTRNMTTTTNLLTLFLILFSSFLAADLAFAEEDNPNPNPIWPLKQGKKFQTRLAISCAPMVYTRVDPLTSFNETCSDHIHLVYGNKHFRSALDFEKDMKKEDTTCIAHNDFSSYWSPALYSRDRKGVLHPVPITRNTVYYQTSKNSEPDGTELTRPFKRGFRMKGGNFHVDPANPVIPEGNYTYANWICNKPKQDNKGHGDFRSSFLELDDGKPCWSIMARVNFPDCFQDYKDKDGVTRHKFTYSNINNGRCPSTHPNRLPLLSLNQEYSMRGLKLDQLVLSNGDPTGRSLHGDFVSGWDTADLDHALKNCVFNPRETNRFHGDNCKETDEFGDIPLHPRPYPEEHAIYEDTFPNEEVFGITEFPRGEGNC